MRTISYMVQAHEKEEWTDLFVPFTSAFDAYQWMQDMSEANPKDVYRVEKRISGEVDSYPAVAMSGVLYYN